MQFSGIWNTPPSPPPHQIQAGHFIPQSRDSGCFFGRWEVLMTVCSMSLCCCTAHSAARKGVQRLLFSRHGQEFLQSMRCQMNIFNLLSDWLAFPSCFFHCLSPSKSSSLLLSDQTFSLMANIITTAGKMKYASAYLNPSADSNPREKGKE